MSTPENSANEKAGGADPVADPFALVTELASQIALLSAHQFAQSRLLIKLAARLPPEEAIEALQEFIADAEGMHEKLLLVVDKVSPAIAARMDKRPLP
jgi:hypothetical protein